jgi:hypothetical protein
VWGFKELLVKKKEAAHSSAGTEPALKWRQRCLTVEDVRAVPVARGQERGNWRVRVKKTVVLEHSGLRYTTGIATPRQVNKVAGAHRNKICQRNCSNKERISWQWHCRTMDCHLKASERGLTKGVGCSVLAVLCKG